MPKELKQKSLKNLELMTMEEWQRNRHFMKQIKDDYPKLYKILYKGDEQMPAYMVF